jgi:DNA-binding transcriptional ArsR family regulator
LFDGDRTRPFDEYQTMTESPSPELVTVLQALSDPVRLEIVRQLAGCSEGSALSCGQIELEVTKSTASHHLKTLRTAGITAEREEGTRKYTWLRKAELEERFPGLLEAVLRPLLRSGEAAAAAGGSSAAPRPPSPT